MISKSKKLLLSFLIVSIAIFIVPITFKTFNSYASVQAASIKISTKSKTLYIGYGCKLNITGTSRKVTWSSTNPQIASVSQSGYVTAKSKGTTTIIAKVKGKTYKCNITVNKAASMDIYSTRSMKFIGTTKKVTYTSSDTKIASIDKNGKVTSKKVGTVTITAKINGKKYSCILNVKADGWVTDTKGNIYYYKNNKKLTGWNYVGKYKYYFNTKTGILDQNVADRLTGLQTYYIHVNRKQCKITIFAQDGDKGYSIPVMAMTCSVGTSKTPTPTGTYNTKEKYRWRTLMGPSYGQYATKIVGGIYFHSVAGYNKTSYNIYASDYNKLGKPASHGCIRLCVRDAKWIYDNCKIGTTVTIDDKSDGCKFAKPTLKKIKSYQHYDPTDPNIKK